MAWNQFGRHGHLQLLRQRQSLTPTSGSTLSYSYDAANRLSQISQAAGLGAAQPATAQTIGIIYDTSNRPTKLTLPNGISQKYSYDNAGQVTAINYQKADTTVIGTLTYSYNTQGNRTRMGGSLARTGLPTATNLQYDANNRLTQRAATAFTYDNSGNLTNDGSHGYTWNARNQLTAITGSDTVSYAYDAFGRRRSATINGQTTKTLYDGWNPIQLQSGGSVIENQLTGLGLDAYYARTRSSVSESYLTDALGSTLELRNAAQAQTVQYTYDPYGNTSASTTSTNTLKYTGREQDLTDLYYYRNRYYMPSISRFISEDPIGLAGGVNLYGYVVNNPVNLIDSLGLKKKFPYSHPHCQAIKTKIDNINKDLDERWDELSRNPGELPERIGPGEALSETIRGHRTLINKESSRLDYWQNRYDDECGDDDDGDDSPPNCPPLSPVYIIPILIPMLLPN